jgi:hypothetical protein
VKLIGAALPRFANERVQIPPDQDGFGKWSVRGCSFWALLEVTKKGVTQVYGILCPSRSRYMFGLLWIVEERISGYFRMGWAAPILG